MIVCLKHTSVNSAYEDPWLVSSILWISMLLLCQDSSWSEWTMERNWSIRAILLRLFPLSFCSIRCFLWKLRWTFPFLSASPEDTNALTFSFSSNTWTREGLLCFSWHLARHWRAPPHHASLVLAQLGGIFTMKNQQQQVLVGFSGDGITPLTSMAYTCGTFSAFMCHFLHYPHAISVPGGCCILQNN